MQLFFLSLVLKNAIHTHSYIENEKFIDVTERLPFTERFTWLMTASLSLLTLGVLVFLYKTIKQVG